jgi:hypothetical protein
VEQHEPPRALRRRLMATVRAEARAERGDRQRWWRGGAVTFRARPALGLGAAALLAAGVIGYGLNAAQDEGGAPPLQAEVQQRGEDAVLRVSSLPEPEGNEVYQAWFRAGRRVKPSVTFTPNEDGTAVAELGRAPRGAEEVLVTIEPPGGSREPSLPTVLETPIS